MEEIAAAFDGVLLIEIALSEVVVSCVVFVVVVVGIDDDTAEVGTDIDVVDVDTVLRDVLLSHFSW